MTKAKGASPGAARKTKKAVAPPSYEEIALHAYHIYLQRGCTPGDPLQDWLQAERELLELAQKPGRKSKIVSIAA
jgi:Protein of unknown function (DUF2934)